MNDEKRIVTETVRGGLKAHMQYRLNSINPGDEPFLEFVAWIENELGWDNKEIGTRALESLWKDMQAQGQVPPRLNEQIPVEVLDLVGTANEALSEMRDLMNELQSGKFVMSPEGQEQLNRTKQAFSKFDNAQQVVNRGNQSIFTGASSFGGAFGKTLDEPEDIDEDF